MTKKELSNYAGVMFYNLSTRAGAKRGTLYRLTVYRVTERGTCKFHACTSLMCIANKVSWKKLGEVTGGLYHHGRPKASNLDKDFMEASASMAYSFPEGWFVV